MAKPDSTVESLDDLSDEFAQKWRRKENPSIEEYASRYPHWAEQIRDLFPMVILMEQMKPAPRSASELASRAIPSEEVPRRLGEYQILREIGRGGMGVVYEAIQETLDRRVAIKLLPSHLTRDQKILSRFRRESQAAARLHHTNIVPVFGVGEQNGTYYYIMQMIEGVSIDQLLLPVREKKGTPLHSREAATAAWTREGITTTPVTPPKSLAESGPPPLSHRMVARIGYQVADALSYAHLQGVLHRDIKPSNLILDRHGTVWITDFGVAKLIEETNLTQSGDLVGTLRYLPPERFQGTSDGRGDIYSLGITLYEMLLKRPAFPNTTPHHLIQQIIQTELPPLRTVDRRIPVDLERIVAKATSREPKDRYASASDFADDLHCFLEDMPIRARRIGPVEQIYRWCCRNKTLAGLSFAAIALLLLTTIVSSFAYWRVSAAIVAEKNQRQRAEKTSAAALEAFNQIYEKFAPNRLIVAPNLVTTGPEGETINIPTQPILAPEAVPLLQELLVFYQQLALEGSDFPSLQIQAAEANQRIGDIRQRLGQLELARDAYREAIKLYSLHNTATADVNQPIKLARAYNDLGRCLRVLQQPELARDAHSSALTTLLNNVSDQSSRPEFRFESARTYYFLSIRREMGPLAGFPAGDRPPGPEGERRGPGPRNPGDHRPPGRDRPPPNGPPDSESFGRAITLLVPLVKEHPGVPEYRHLLACCYRDSPPNRGPDDHRQGPPSDPGNLNESLKILRDLVRDFPRVPEYQYELVETLTRLANPRRLGPNSPLSQDKLPFLEEALEVTNRLMTEYPGVMQSSASSALVNDRLGLYYLGQSQPADAEKYLRKAITLQTNLVKQHPDLLNLQGGLVLTQASLARTLLQMNHPAEARQQLEGAITRLESLQSRNSNAEFPRGMLSRLYFDLAEVLLSLNQPEEAQKAKLKARAFGPPGNGKPNPRP